MNINDFKIKKEIFSGDRLALIFKRQKALMEKYHDIEKKSGLIITEDNPVNLHDIKGQARLKDFAWRITEELGEALGAFEIHSDLTDHFDEEIADALHFLVEFTILSGVTYKDIVNGVKDIVLKYVNPSCNDDFDFLFEYAVYTMDENKVKTRKYEDLAYYTGRIVQQLGECCNTLKNKPWKQSQMLTDELGFKIKLKTTWKAFIQLCLCAGIFSNKLFEMYYSKSEVNKFRIRSNY